MLTAFLVFKCFAGGVMIAPAVVSVITLKRLARGE